MLNFLLSRVDVYQSVKGQRWLHQRRIKEWRWVLQGAEGNANESRPEWLLSHFWWAIRVNDSQSALYMTISLAAHTHEAQDGGGCKAAWYFQWSDSLLWIINRKLRVSLAMKNSFREWGRGRKGVSLIYRHTFSTGLWLNFRPSEGSIAWPWWWMIQSARWVKPFFSSVVASFCTNRYTRFRETRRAQRVCRKEGV